MVVKLSGFTRTKFNPAPSKSDKGTIFIASRAEVEYYGIHNREALDYSDIISINDERDGYLFEPENGSNLRSYIFRDDVPRKGYYTQGLFSRSQAVSIINFLLDRDRSRPLIVHCFAGVCRSSATSLFAAALYGQNVDELYERYPYIEPNWWVLRLLTDVWETHFDLGGNCLTQDLDKFAYLDVI